MDSIEYLSRCYREIVPSKKISLMVELDAGANSLHEELRICPRDGTSVPNQASVGFPSRPKLVDAKELPKRALSTDEGRGAFFHAICHIEFTAINLAIDAALRFSAMPFDYYRDWLQIAKEEAIHFGLLRDHLNALGYDYGDFDAHDGMWQLAQRTADDVILRMALIPRVLEARGLDVTPPESANQKLRALAPEVLLVAHGAAMETPDDAQYILNHTSCDGFWTGSSTERLPIERAITEAAGEFAALTLPQHEGAQ
ncbi:MAG: DUF455 family protein [Pseudomonadota bacterium]